MKKFLLFSLCFISINAFSQKHKNKAEDKFAGLDTAFARVLKDWHAAGFAVAVVEKDKVVYANGFGYRDYETKIPVTANTVFAIGSCSKAFTASLLGLLNKDGKVDFDKPVRNYLPELKFYNDEMNDHITLRDMMSHRTGLPRHDYSWYLFQSHSKDSLLQRIQYMEPSAGLREKWQYNNFMFMAQGMVAEKLTGKSWEENIREKIFQPLGMTSSDASLNEWIKTGEPALGYDVKNDTIIKRMNYYDIAGMSPAGSINSTVNDMAKWVITWINGGKYSGKELLPSSYVSQAISSQMVMSGALPDKQTPDIYFSNYGFGWMMASYRGHYRVEHGGNIDGFSASTCFFPSDSIGIVVLCNQNSSPVPSVVRNLIADRMLGLKYYDWQTALKSSSDSAKAQAKRAEKSVISNQKLNTKPSHDIKDYEGAYTNPGYGTFNVELVNDSLFITGITHTFWLKHYHYDVFTLFDKDPKDGIDTSDQSTQLQFNTGLNGDIENASIALEPTLKPIVFTRTLREKIIDSGSLKAYIGDYELAGAPVKLKVYTKNDNKLYLFVEGQPEYELAPVDKDKFALKNMNGFTVQFNRNDKNEVIELLSIQPNGTFKAKKSK
ncbi:serine hydrolase [Parafilimonas terrae]|uniref:CubicO group peptidase, beta-lactamase class C family n=1 Tax=Parafilimonas terrae TaxID=1465490 RepID=A0A1I5WWB2_9BACT|nr:serine hydrolase [Parafilimonas terrae]SFQ24043.1 CubicO group peptidase, beta-lactamase class C family [Parafilimonas terrae]